MDDVVNFRQVLAETKSDSRLWTAEDAVEDLLKKIRAGEVNPGQLAIHYFEKAEDGSMTHHYQISGVTYPEHLALLAVAKRRVLNEWVSVE